MDLCVSCSVHVNWQLCWYLLTIVQAQIYVLSLHCLTGYVYGKVVSFFYLFRITFLNPLCENIWVFFFTKRRKNYAIRTGNAKADFFFDRFFYSYYLVLNIWFCCFKLFCLICANNLEKWMKTQNSCHYKNIKYSWSHRESQEFKKYSPRCTSRQGCQCQGGLDVRNMK